MGKFLKPREAVIPIFLKWDRMRETRVKTQKIKKMIRKQKDIPQLTEKQAKEIKKFWAQYGIDVPLYWHRLFYYKTGIEDPRFVPDTVFNHYIKLRMSDKVFTMAWGDKSYLDYFVRDVKVAHSVVRNVSGRFLDENFNLISAERAQEIVSQYDKLVIKPTVNTHTGLGVALLEAPVDLSAIQAKYRKDYVLQIPLKQHAGISKLNASSINSIRVNTVLFDNKAHVMSAFVKVGQAGAFADNHGSDRYFIGIKTNGTYCDYAIDYNLNKYDTIPSGYAFAGDTVPCFDKLCEAACKAHECIPRFGFAFWDICLNEDGEAVIVEANLRNPSTLIPQSALGPFLGDYTEEIMEYIRDRKPDDKMIVYPCP